jgi:hypothetical protein
MTDKIATSAEAHENAHLPGLREVHTDPNAQAAVAGDVPKALKDPKAPKSPAQWAYERIIMYIQNFEKQLDNDQEVGMGFVGGDAGVIKIEGLGFYDPDLVTFYGRDGAGVKTQLIQHVTQMNVMLRAAPKEQDQAEPNRIGFRLAEELNREEDATL